MNALFVCGMSRSGTTLLTTMLDAHPSISMGYELLPGDLPPLDQLADLLDRAWDESNKSPRKSGNLLKQWGHPQAGVFTKRASRAMIDPPELANILRQCAKDGFSSCKSPDEKFRLALMVSKAKATKENAHWFGFKAGHHDHKRFTRLTQSHHTIIIHRDPRDVWASHMGAGFAATIDQAARSWNQHAQGLKNPDLNCTHIKYESLIQSPEQTLKNICNHLNINDEPSMIQYQESKASIFREGLHHVNTPKLLEGINDSAINRWKSELDSSDIQFIEQTCRTGMKHLEYQT